MKIKLTNTWKHAGVGAIVGLVGLIVMNTASLIAFTVLAVGLIFAIWEVNQLKRYISTHNWISGYNLIDSIVDFLAGFICFNATFWFIQYLNHR